MVIKDLSKESIIYGIQKQLDTIESQRTKERYKMMNYYEAMTSEMESDINKWFDSESLKQAPKVVSGITPKLINGRAICYKQTPERQVDERYWDYVNDLDSAMLQAERLTYLLGSHATRVSWDNDKLNYTPLLEFYPIFLPHKPEPVACVYPIYNHSSNALKKEQVFAFWSDENHFMLDGNGNIVDNPDNPDRLNPYQIKPIIYSHRKVLTTDWFREGASDIVSVNKTINILLTEMSLSMRLGLLGQPVISGIDEANRLRMGVDKPIILPDGASFQFASPSPNLKDYVEAIRFIVDSTAYNHNLKTKWSVGREGSVSGESLKMAEIELTESIMLDAQMIWRPFERQRFEVDKAIIEYETNTSLGEEYAVDFSEPRFSLTANEERLQWEWEWNHGLSSKKDWFRKNNPDAIDEQIDDIVERVAEEGVPTTPEQSAIQSTAFNLRQALSD